ncbi:MAG: hypothetical protein CMJ89_01965 [Planctomycetes bacterium]|nr:hypothetical protein [Planctomycetota bacterium]
MRFSGCGPGEPLQPSLEEPLASSRGVSKGIRKGRASDFELCPDLLRVPDSVSHIRRLDTAKPIPETARDVGTNPETKVHPTTIFSRDGA